MFRKFIYWLNGKIGLGPLPIARVKTGKNETATLRNDGWVVISDGKSTDALPITLCSSQIIQAFTAELE